MDAADQDSLREELEEELIRGVPLHTCLSGWAKHWAKNSGMFAAAENLWNLSQQTARFDHFLSHDWSTARWEKLLAMLVAFNSPAAAIATLLVSTMTILIVTLLRLPPALMQALPSYSVFWFVFCFWQRIRGMFRRPLTVFFDKLCIAQHDEKLKIKTVYGLASFLNHSDSLFILWSPRYFSRIWCAYELATFMRDPAKLKSIQMMPTKAAALQLVYAMLMQLTYGASMALATPSDTSVLSQVMFVLALAAAIFLAVALSLYICMQLMEDIEELPKQLAGFDIQSSKCWCCSNNHRHPVTGENIPCDRRLVYKALRKAYGSIRDAETGNERPEHYLEIFNAVVRGDLATRVLRSMGTTAIRMDLTIFMVCSPSLWYLVYFFPIYAALGNDFVGYELFVWWVRCLLHWAILPLNAVFSMQVLVVFCGIGNRWMMCNKTGCKRTIRAVTAALLVLPTIFVSGLPWMLFEFVRAITYTPSLAPALPFLGLLMIDLYVCCPRRSTAKAAFSESASTTSTAQPIGLNAEAHLSREDSLVEEAF